jgi:hypothetical protein
VKNGWLSQVRARIGCMLGRHSPNRNRVRRSTGIMYVGICRNCGATIRKRHGHQWRAYRPDAADKANDDQAVAVDIEEAG